MTRRVACCPRCDGDVPLVMTFAFYGAEFYCLDCGGRFGFLDPIGRDETPDLLEAMESRKNEWAENAGLFLLVPGSGLTTCERCKAGPDHFDHPGHATDEERAADVRAREWIKERLVPA